MNSSNIRDKLSNFQCTYQNHTGNPVISLCIHPGCQELITCCQVCEEKVHNHKSSEYLKLQNFNQQEYDLISVKEGTKFLESLIQQSVKKLPEFVDQNDPIKQFIDTPSTENLKLIGQAIKKQKYKRINDKIQGIKTYFEKEITELREFILDLKQDKLIYQLATEIEQIQQVVSYYPEQTKTNSKIQSAIIQETPEEISKISYNLLKSGSYIEALEHANKALNIDPKCTQALQHKAESLRLTGKVEEAIKYADQAIAVSPYHKESIQSKAQCLILLDRPAEALTLAEKALSIDPKFKQALFTKAEALVYLNQYEQAIQFADKALQVDSEYIDALGTKAAALHYSGRYEDANRIAMKALGINSNYYLALYINAEALRAQKMFVEAKSYAQRAIEAKEDACSYFCLAESQRMTGEFEQSIYNAEIAIKLQDKYKDPYVCKALSLYQLKRFDESFQAINKALEIDQNCQMSKQYKEKIQQALQKSRQR